MSAGVRACRAASTRTASKARARISAPASRPRSSRIGSQHSPGTKDIATKGGTSGGAPASSNSTSGTTTPGRPCRARMSVPWRSTSRLRTGGRPGGATFSTMGTSSPPGRATRARNVRLEAPPVRGTTSPTTAPGVHFSAAACARRRRSSCNCWSSVTAASSGGNAILHMQNGCLSMTERHGRVRDMTGSAAEAADVPLAERAVRRRLAERQQLAQDEVTRLLDAALHLMTAEPDRPPRVSDVVRTAGVTNQVFYRSFDSRDDLLAAVVDDGARRLVMHVARLMDRAADGAGRLRAFVDAVLEQAVDPVATTTRAVLSGTVRHGDQTARSRVWVADRLAAALSPDLAVLGSDDPDRDARALTHAVLGTMEHFLWQQQQPVADDAERLCTLLLAAVGTEARGIRPART